ncbi:MAG: hypothetical protein AB2A00_08060 [Myxococcota bacterium]
MKLRGISRNLLGILVILAVGACDSGVTEDPGDAGDQAASSSGFIRPNNSSGVVNSSTGGSTSGGSSSNGGSSSGVASSGGGSSSDGGTSSGGGSSGSTSSGGPGEPLACNKTCSAPSDCAGFGALMDADNWECAQGLCDYLGCLTDGECSSTVGAGYVCGDDGACVKTCTTVTECASSAGQLFGEDNWSCESNTCRYLGCNSDDECAADNGANYVCRAGACVRSCTGASDCAFDGTQANDADNWACTGGLCEYLGCNTTSECQADLGNAYVCGENGGGASSSSSSGGGGSSSSGGGNGSSSSGNPGSSSGGPGSSSSSGGGGSSSSGDPNCQFPAGDSDADNIPNDVEACADPDGDNVPAYLDDDADGDGLLDINELLTDSDGDGQLNSLDSDSDNDGLGDGAEGPLGTNPYNADSDGDDLLDGDEVNTYGTNPASRNTDGDAYDDNVEVALGTDPTTVTNPGDPGAPEFFFVLPVRGLEQNDDLPFSTNLRQADVHINIDTTFSMDGEIVNLRQALSNTIIPGINDQVADVGFGVSKFEDFPMGTDPIEYTADGITLFGGYGSANELFLNAFFNVYNGFNAAQAYSAGLAAGTGNATDDKPFELIQRITTNEVLAQQAVDALVLGLGGDGPESGFESLRQIATGSGITYPRDPSAKEFLEYYVNNNGNLPPATYFSDNERTGVVAPFDGNAAGEGTIGGVGFRSGSLPIVLHITDILSHEQQHYLGRDDNGNPIPEPAQGFHGNVFCGTGAGNRDAVGCSPSPASQSETVAALQGIRARVIGVGTVDPQLPPEFDPRPQLESIANATGAVVPACSFDFAAGGRPAGCAVGQCCTGINGAGRAANAGQCPLVYDSAADGSGLAGTIVTGVTTLVDFSTNTVTARVVGEPAVDAFNTPVDTACFIKRVVPTSATNPYPGCAPDAVPADLSPVDGVNDSFTSVTPGATIAFDVVAQNLNAAGTDPCARADVDPLIFSATIQVVADNVTVLDEQQVVIVVPPGDGA